VVLALLEERRVLREAATEVLDYLETWVRAPGERGLHPHAEVLTQKLRAALQAEPARAEEGAS
jgi:hypothetical protein